MEIFLELILFILIVLVVIFALFCISAVLFYICKSILFRLHYGSMNESVAIITDMFYESSQYNVITKLHDPEKNIVYFKTDQGDTAIDSYTLYQRVRIDEKIDVFYQIRYIEPRFWKGSLKFDGYRLNSIRTHNGQMIIFNDEKDTSKKLANHLDMCEHLNKEV